LTALPKEIPWGVQINFNSHQFTIVAFDLRIDDPDAQDLILEYQIDLGNIDEYYESFGELPAQEEIHRIPSFLTSNYQFDRVVNFYSPWCAHCQKFKPRFIDVASKFKDSNSNKELQAIEFHAVSCSAHHWLCKASSIQGYPIVRTYRKGTADFHEVKRFTPQAMAASYGIQLEKIYSSSSNEFQDVDLRHYDEDVYDVLGAAMDAYRRTKKDVFHDACVSLLFALQFDVNVDGDDDSRTARLEAFSKWVDLLYWSLPSSWKVNTLINDIRTNTEFAAISNGIISNAVEINKDVVLPDPSMLWTNSCQRRSRKSEGYTCGMWSLFHIISIGVAEQHHAVIGNTDMVSTEYVAETIRDYINNFLGCNICRKNFNDLYKKSCGEQKDGRCDRFNRNKHTGKRTDPRKKPNAEYWQDLALWLWEIHNSINLEVLRERKRIDNKEPTKEELAKAIYPSVESCPLCRNRNGIFDKSEVYKFLKTQYWPEGVHNFRYVVLKSKRENLKITKVKDVSAFETWWQLVGLFLSMLITIGSRYYRKRAKMTNKGKHKKEDGGVKQQLQPKNIDIRAGTRSARVDGHKDTRIRTGRY
jgi:thiol-disulfide isomerase/thioredoxin